MLSFEGSRLYLLWVGPGLEVEETISFDYEFGDLATLSDDGRLFTYLSLAEFALPTEAVLSFDYDF